MHPVYPKRIRRQSPGFTQWLSYPLDRGVMLAVRGYQRYVSPHKGYCCAHRALHGGPSCSEYFRQAVRRHGSLRAVPLLKQRFAECRNASRQLQLIRRASRAETEIVFSTDGDEPQQPPEESQPRRQRKLRGWASDMLTGCCTPADGSSDCFGLESICGNGDADGGSFDCQCDNPCDCADGWSCCD
jgi:putative component of membrane protein insertase Oxa1/YidC/SpoIIIJ protein YidD